MKFNLLSKNTVYQYYYGLSPLSFLKICHLNLSLAVFSPNYPYCCVWFFFFFNHSVTVTLTYSYTLYRERDFIFASWLVELSYYFSFGFRYFLFLPDLWVRLLLVFFGIIILIIIWLIQFPFSVLIKNSFFCSDKKIPFFLAYSLHSIIVLVTCIFFEVSRPCFPSYSCFTISKQLMSYVKYSIWFVI